jgi:hypothetical protein
MLMTRKVLPQIAAHPANAAQGRAAGEITGSFAAG